MTVIWRCGVIGNTRDSDSLVLGSRPNGATNMASSYNGSTGGFEPFGGSPILSLAATLTKITYSARDAPGRTWARLCPDKSSSRRR